MFAFFLLPKSPRSKFIGHYPGFPYSGGPWDLRLGSNVRSPPPYSEDFLPSLSQPREEADTTSLGQAATLERGRPVP